MWFSKVVNVVRSADRFGNNFEMNHKKSSTFKTVPGAAVTLAVVGVLIWYVVRLIQQTVDTTSPTVTTLQQNIQDDTKYSLVENELLPVFVFVNKTEGNPMLAEFHSKYATVQAEVITLSEFNRTRTVFPLVPCSNLTNKKPYKTLFDEKYMNRTFLAVFSCLEVPEDEKLEVFGSILKDESQYVTVSMYPCSLPDVDMCAKENLLYEFVAGTLDVNKYIEFSNLDDPIKKTFQITDNLLFLKDVGTIMTRYVGNVKISDIQDSITQTPSKELNYAQIVQERMAIMSRFPSLTCTEAQVKGEGACLPYLYFEYRYSGVIDNYTRTYPDVFSAFSAFGGFKEIVNTVAILLLFLYNELAAAYFLRNTFIGIAAVTSLHSVAGGRPAVEGGGEEVPEEVVGGGRQLHGVQHRHRHDRE